MRFLPIFSSLLKSRIKFTLEVLGYNQVTRILFNSLIVVSEKIDIVGRVVLFVLVLILITLFIFE